MAMALPKQMINAKFLEEKYPYLLKTLLKKMTLSQKF
jgi:hypothetical protein